MKLSAITAPLPPLPASSGEGGRFTPPPPVVEETAEADTALDQQSLHEAVAVMQARMGGEPPSLRFRVDQDSGRLVVQVIAAEDGAVLRQIPSEEALRIARALQSPQEGRAALIERQV